MNRLINFAGCVLFWALSTPIIVFLWTAWLLHNAWCALFPPSTRPLTQAELDRHIKASNENISSRNR